MGAGTAFFGLQTALIVHAVAAPLIFAAVSAVYFTRFSFTGPLITALLFLAIVVAMDAVVVAMLVLRSFEMFTSVVGTWLPFLLIFVSTWVTGLMIRRRN